MQSFTTKHLQLLRKSLAIIATGLARNDLLQAKGSGNKKSSVPGLGQNDANDNESSVDIIDELSTRPLESSLEYASDNVSKTDKSVTKGDKQPLSHTQSVNRSLVTETSAIPNVELQQDDTDHVQSPLTNITDNGDESERTNKAQLSPISSSRSLPAESQKPLPQVETPDSREHSPAGLDLSSTGYFAAIPWQNSSPDNPNKAFDSDVRPKSVLVDGNALNNPNIPEPNPIASGIFFQSLPWELIDIAPIVATQTTGSNSDLKCQHYFQDLPWNEFSNPALKEDVTETRPIVQKQSSAGSYFQDLSWANETTIEQQTAKTEQTRAQSMEWMGELATTTALQAAANNSIALEQSKPASETHLKSSEFFHALPWHLDSRVINKPSQSNLSLSNNQQSEANLQSNEKPDYHPALSGGEFFQGIPWN